MILFITLLSLNTNYNGHFMPLLSCTDRGIFIRRHNLKNGEKGRPKREQIKFFANCYRPEKNRAEFKMATEQVRPNHQT